MKLLEFEITKSENPSEIGKARYVVKLSTLNERELYERTNVIAEDCPANSQAHDDWDKRLQSHLDVTDNLVFYYLMEDEPEPKVGETFKLDDLELKRRA